MKSHKSKLKFSFGIFKIVILNLFVIWSLLFGASLTFASETNGTIVSGGNAGYAWSNQAGWVNFGATNSNIQISDGAITGYAWNSNYGWINMAPTNGGITISASGALSGYAWGSSLGWINFSGASINSSGKFTGTASGTIVGTLTFDCTNCSVTTDYRPANFRTTTTPTPTPSGGGGGRGGGSGISSGVAASVPSSITASNVPLTVAPSQSGTLTQNLSGDKKVELRVESGTAPSTLTFTVGEQTVSVSAVAGTSIVGGGIFDIQAFNVETGERVRSFGKPVQITLTVPEELQGRSDLGVYFLNEELNAWEKISDVTFSGASATFLVDHLTLFGIFSASDLPTFIQPFFTIPSASGVAPSAAPSGTEVELTEETLLPAQLFDIRLLLDRNVIPRIEDLVARVTFESFGRVPTPVEMTFTLLDAEGNEIWTSVDTTTVQTSAVFVKRFISAPSLTPGSYTARLDTLYDTDVHDTFEAPFTVLSEDEASSYWILWLIGGILFVLSLTLIFIWWRRGEDENKAANFP